jgi:hypothetical protein
MNGENDMDMLTDTQFYALARYSNGRIKDLPLYYYRMTPEQVECLHGDDWSYYQELQEEVAYELSFYR